jgi:hypothetical protein
MRRAHALLRAPLMLSAQCRDYGNGVLDATTRDVIWEIRQQARDVIDRRLAYVN